VAPHTHPERHDKVTEAEQVLARALPLVEEAAGSPVGGAVSIRHDAMDAIEETLRTGQFDEIMLATHPHGVSSWLHVDLSRWIARLGLPGDHFDYRHIGLSWPEVARPEGQGVQAPVRNRH